MAQHTDIDPSALGPNMWLIDEMYRRFREDPDSVGPAWKDFFEGFTPALGVANGGGGAVEPAEELRAASPHPTPPSAPPPAESAATAPSTPPPGESPTATDVQSAPPPESLAK